MSVPSEDGADLGRPSVAHGAAARPEPAPDLEPAPSGVQVGRLFGIPIYLEPAWLLVAAGLLTYVVQRRAAEEVPGSPAYLLGLSFAVFLYVSVLVHELAHSVVALGFGMRVRRISLQLLGGVSEIEEEAATPGREFAISFAGPALSFGLYGIAKLIELGLPENGVAWWLVRAVAEANLVVGVFNLLPGLPLDGGRVLQSVVWQVSGNRLRGAVVASWCGRGLALALLSLIPLFLMAGGFLIVVVWTAVIAAFLWVGAGSSLRVARFRARMPQLQARVLSRRAVAVRGATTVEVALRRAILSHAAGIVVVGEDGAPEALVNESAVRAMPEERRKVVPVSELARRLDPGLVLAADLTGEPLLRALQRTQATEYLLVEPDGQVAGVLLAVDVERATAGW